MGNSMDMISNQVDMNSRQSNGYDIPTEQQDPNRLAEKAESQVISWSFTIAIQPIGLIVFAILCLIMASYLDFLYINGFCWASFILIPLINLIAHGVICGLISSDTESKSRILVITYLIICIFTLFLTGLLIGIGISCITKTWSVYMNPGVGFYQEVPDAYFARMSWNNAPYKEKVAKIAIALFIYQFIFLVIGFLHFSTIGLALVFFRTFWYYGKKPNSTTTVYVPVPNKHGPIQLIIKRDRFEEDVCKSLAAFD